MIDQRRLDANRRNTHLSTGPRAPILIHHIADYYRDNQRFRGLPPELRPSFITGCDVDNFLTRKSLSLLKTRLQRSIYRALYSVRKFG